MASLTLAVPLVMIPARAQTANFTWQNASGSNDWTVGANWVGGVAPGPGANASLIFGNTSRPFPNMNVSYSVSSLSFISNASAYTIGSDNGSSLTLGAGGIGQSSSNQQTINVGSVVLGALQTWNINSGGLVMAAPVSGGSSAGLTKTGTGTLTLLGNNTYSGGTTISGGTVNVGSSTTASTLGTGPITVGAGATLNFNGSSSVENMAITNTGSVFFNASTTGGTGAAFTNNGGSVNFNGPSSFTLGSLSGAGLVRLGSTALTVGELENTETISGIISGTGSLTKVGSGTLTLSGSNTFTGGLQVNSGTVLLNTANAGGAGIVAVTGGNPDFTTPGSSATLNVSAANALSGVTSLSVTGGNSNIFTSGGNATLNASTGNSLTGVTSLSVTGGTGDSFTTGGNATLNASAASVLSGVTSLSITGGSSGGFGTGGNATLNVSAASALSGMTSLSITGGSSGAYATGGNAVLSFNVNDTSLSNKTSVVLRPGSKGSSSAAGQSRIDLNGFSLTLGGIDTLGVVDDNLIVQNGGSTNSILTVGTDNAAHNFGGQIRDGSGGGTLALTKTGLGALTLSGSSTYTGGTTISGGTLTATSVSSLGSGVVTNNASLVFSADNDGTFSQVISGTGTLSKSGVATLTLSGNNTYSGGTTISGGTLVATSAALGSGAITDNGALVISNSSGGTISATISGTGTLTKTGAGTLALSGNNTYTGGTTLNGSTLLVGSNTAFGTGAVTLNGTTLQASGGARTLANAISIAAPMTLSTGTVTTSDSKTPGLTLAGAVTLASDGALTVTGNTRTAITGKVSEDSTVRTLVKDGAGTLVLTNDNTYTGGTVVRGGTLVVNNAYNRTATGSGTGEGAVTVARGAALTGQFVISGPVQVNSGGRLAIGNSIGHSQVSSLSLTGGSLLDFEIGADGVSSDHLDITGLLSRSGTSTAPITFLLSGEHLADGSIASLSTGTFTLLTYGTQSGFLASDFAASGLSADWTSYFTMTGGSGGVPGALRVTLMQNAVTAAPEPGSLLLLLTASGVVDLVFLKRRNCGARQGETL